MISSIIFGVYAIATLQSVAAMPQASSGTTTTTSTSSNPASSGTSGSGGPFANARLTFYTAGLGACGETNTDADAIVALNQAQYAGGAHCKQQITITVNGKSKDATIMDLCPGCPYGGLDLTPSLFSFFGDQAAGVLTGEWSFKDGSNGSASTTGASTTGASSTGASSTGASSTGISSNPGGPAGSSWVSTQGATSTQTSVPGVSSTIGITSSPTLAPGVSATTSPTIAPGAESSHTLPAGVMTTLEGVPRA